MSQILVIADDPRTLLATEDILQLSGHSVLTAQSAVDALRLFKAGKPAVVITDLRLLDASGLDVLRAMRQTCREVPVIVVADQTAAAAPRVQTAAFDPADAQECEAHAAARWARCVVRIVAYPKDPRTLAKWSRWILASEGALKNWCWAAGLSPRRSLVFGRLLRVVCRSEGEGGRHLMRDMLDIVDRRTLTNLLRYAGFEDERTFPREVPEFLSRQQLVRDADMMIELKKELVASMLLPPTAIDGNIGRQSET
jgi:CheY-like chemotaxis protein